MPSKSYLKLPLNINEALLKKRLFLSVEEI